MSIDEVRVLKYLCNAQDTLLTSMIDMMYTASAATSLCTATRRFIMGSRGMAIESGFVEYKYYTIMRDGKVRFIVQNEGRPVKLPEKSNSINVIYATLGYEGDLKSVTFFRGRKKYKEIDIDHKHHGMQPHVHMCDVKESIRDKSVPVRLMTTRERNRVQKIIDFYNANGLKEMGDRRTAEEKAKDTKKGR